MQIISGIHKNRKLFTPAGLQTRPTSSRLRETLFNICQNYIENALFLDLFAGSGAMGFEALSRYAKHVTFVDNHKESIKVIYKNIELLSVESQSKVIFSDVFQFIDKLAKKENCYNIIYADPPYNTYTDDNELLSASLLKKLDMSKLLVADGDLFIEDAQEVNYSEIDLCSLKMVSVRRHGKAVLHHFRCLK